MAELREDSDLEMIVAGVQEWFGVQVALFNIDDV